MTADSWDPALYTAFADHRLRPARDLIARIPLGSVTRVIDLGCGEGAPTALLADRWPTASITGIDSSAAMLAAAAARLPDARITWQRADIAGWRAPAPVDLVFSNATLHWLNDNLTRIPALLTDAVRPGGVLAVQMPANQDAPTHTLILETARTGPWAERLGPLLADPPNQVAAPEAYWRALAPLCDGLDVWTTTYIQRLEGADPVARWTKGAALRPWLAALDEPAQAAFFDAYAARIRDAYPPGPDGSTLLPFRRLFIVGRKPP